MQQRVLSSLLLLSLTVLIIGCSDDDSPTGCDCDGGQIFLADTTAHLATDILTFYGGAGWDWGTSITTVPGGGYAASGSTDSYGTGKNTLYLVRTDSTGKVLWGKIFGGSGEDNAEAMAITSDDNFILGGVTSSFSGNYDFYLLKVTREGALVWQKWYGSTDLDWGTDIAVLTDGYAITGYTVPGGGADGGNFMLVRTDLNGNEMWTKIYDRPNRGWPYAVVATSDGGFLVVGYVHYDGTSNTDFYAIKTDDTGGVVWEYAYGAGGEEKAFAAIECAGGGYVLAGTTRSFSLSNQQQVYVIKIDANGTAVWDTYFGDGGNLMARDILENTDGSFVMTGNTTNTGSGTGLAKLDASGTLLWSENIGVVAAGMGLFRDGVGSYAVTGFATDSLVNGETDVLLMHVTER